MAEQNAYVAYVGTYTNGTSKGIHIYDVDVKAGSLFLRKVVPVNNSSYLIESRNKKFLYSIADEGVRAYRILPDGDLEPINEININGMRGCHMSVDHEGKYLFVAGYHDGKVTVINTNEDGSLGSLMDGIFHKAVGAVNERSFRPHVCCVRVTPDNQFLCAVDNAIDQVVIYRINSMTNKLQQVDTLRMGTESGPKRIHFSKNGNYAYLLCEITNCVRVYSYSVNGKYPEFELIQEVSTLSNEQDPHDAASALRLSYDGEYLFCSTAGDDSVACYRINQENGKLKKCFALPTSGIYPKDIALFPDQKHLAVVNNGSNTITTFEVNYKKNVLVMKGKPKKLDMPNCMIFHQIEKAPKVITDVSEEMAEAAVEGLQKKYEAVSLKV